MREILDFLVHIRRVDFGVILIILFVILLGSFIAYLVKELTIDFLKWVGSRLRRPRKLLDDGRRLRRVVASFLSDKESVFMLILLAIVLSLAYIRHTFFSR